MTFDPAGGAISGADDVALSNPQNDEVLTYISSVEKWQNQVTPSGGGGSEITDYFSEYDHMPDGYKLPAPTIFCKIDAGTNGSGTEASPYNAVGSAITACSAGDHIYIYADTETEITSGFEVPISKTFYAGNPLFVTIGKYVIISQDAGASDNCTIQTSHVWVNNRGIFDGITSGTGTAASDYDDNLLIIGKNNENSGITFNGYIENVRVQGGIFRNCGKEAIRIKYGRNIRLGYFRIFNTGMTRTEAGLTGSSAGTNGEGIYIGTSPSQLTASTIDRTSDVVVESIDARGLVGTEFVNSKEGTHFITIRNCLASDCRYTSGAAINLQGEASVVERCQLYSNDGAGIRLGVSTSDTAIPNAGQNHIISANDIDGTGDRAIKTASGGTALLSVGNTAANIGTSGGVAVTRDGETKHAQYIFGSFDAVDELARLVAIFTDDDGVAQKADMIAGIVPLSGGGTGTGQGIVLTASDSIQGAINAGEKLIYLQSGTFNVTSTISIGPSQRGVRIVGAGQSTIIRSTAGSSLAALFSISGNVDGVQIESLVIDCDGKADVGLDVNTNGTTGFYQGEPDAVHRFMNLWVYDANISGVHLRGTDTQATLLRNIRVRRAGTYGFNIQAPDNWIRQCEATTQSNTGAGFYVNGANNFIEGCKAWYCRQYGFHIKGTRNTFTNCHSQDTRDHGWYIEWDKNTFVGCIADSAAYYDVGGTVNGADGWYVVGNMLATSIQGCMGFDRQQGASSRQRYGINAPSAMFSADANGQVRIAGFVGYDNATALINQR